MGLGAGTCPGADQQVVRGSLAEKLFLSDKMMGPLNICLLLPVLLSSECVMSGTTAAILWSGDDNHGGITWGTRHRYKTDGTTERSHPSCNCLTSFLSSEQINCVV